MLQQRKRSKMKKISAKYTIYKINANYGDSIKLLEKLETSTGTKAKNQKVTFLTYWRDLFNSIHKNFAGQLVAGGAVQDFIVNALMQDPGYGSKNGRPKDPANAKTQAGIAFSRLKQAGVASKLI